MNNPITKIKAGNVHFCKPQIYWDFYVSLIETFLCCEHAALMVWLSLGRGSCFVTTNMAEIHPVASHLQILKQWLICIEKIQILKLLYLLNICLCLCTEVCQNKNRGQMCHQSMLGSHRNKKRPSHTRHKTQNNRPCWIRLTQSQLGSLGIDNCFQPPLSADIQYRGGGVGEGDRGSIFFFHLTTGVWFSLWFPQVLCY